MVAEVGYLVIETGCAVTDGGVCGNRLDLCDSRGRVFDIRSCAITAGGMCNNRDGVCGSRGGVCNNRNKVCDYRREGGCVITETRSGSLDEVCDSRP